MNFEALQQAWQRQPVPVVADERLLLEKVKSDAVQFDRVIRLRDGGEIVAAVIAGGLFGFKAISHGWPYGFTAAAAWLLALFFVVDRRRQRRWADAFDDSLIGQLDRAIRLTSHQVWLLKNVFWWYLLPLLVGMVLIDLNGLWSLPWRTMLARAAPRLFVDWMLMGGIYWLNQYAVRTRLKPRLAELSTLREQLRSVERE